MYVQARRGEKQRKRGWRRGGGSRLIFLDTATTRSRLLDAHLVIPATPRHVYI